MVFPRKKGDAELKEQMMIRTPKDIMRDREARERALNESSSQISPKGRQSSSQNTDKTIQEQRDDRQQTPQQAKPMLKFGGIKCHAGQVAKPCDPCRWSRQQCDEGQPCSFCLKSYLHCYYPDRGPLSPACPNHESLSVDQHVRSLDRYCQDLASAVRSLEQRLGEVEGSLTSLDNRRRGDGGIDIIGHGQRVTTVESESDFDDWVFVYGVEINDLE